MLCVIAKIDENARQKLYFLQKAAEKEFGIAPRYLHGHVTLLTCVSGEESELIDRSRKALEGEWAFTLNYETIDVLQESSIIVAKAKRCCALDELHGKLARANGEFLDKWTVREKWTPHTTLLYSRNADLQKIAVHMRRYFEPFEARIEEVEFSQVTDDGYRILESFRLKNE